MYLSGFCFNILVPLRSLSNVSLQTVEYLLFMQEKNGELFKVNNGFFKCWNAIYNMYGVLLMFSIENWLMIKNDFGKFWQMDKNKNHHNISLRVFPFISYVLNEVQLQFSSYCRLTYSSLCLKILICSGLQWGFVALRASLMSIGLTSHSSHFFTHRLIWLPFSHAKMTYI